MNILVETEDGGLMMIGEGSERRALPDRTQRRGMEASDVINYFP